MMLHRLTIAAAALFAMAVTAANAQNPEAGYQEGIDRNKVEINSFEDLQNYFRYSPKSVSLISPFFRKVSCMARAARMLCGSWPFSANFRYSRSIGR